LPFSDPQIPSTVDRDAYTVVAEPFARLESHWRRAASQLDWNCLFVRPGWLSCWWASFGTGQDPQIFTVWHRGEPIGIAPLVIEKQRARFIGAPDVCDYLDVVVAPGRAVEFFTELLPVLREMGILGLDLNPLHAESSVVTVLPDIQDRLGCRLKRFREETTFVLRLPSSWEAYLQLLSGKQRHEIRRKLRRLHEAADVSLRVTADSATVAAEMDGFLNLFKTNRPDKAAFMTDTMATFFRRLAETLASEGLLKLYFLDLDDTPAAAAMCFDDGRTMYLYNNGYDRRFNALSVGIMSKVLAIRDAIKRNRARFDFLKGSERYKHRLGGQPQPVYRCRIELL
jgi:CelD/BcsL family acetyltransferase involved in cellulose biosynthesis